MIYIFTGDGKGKTTAAMGTALRTLGYDQDVFVIQFLKAGDSGEIEPLAKLGAQIESFGSGNFVDPENITEEDRRRARRAFLRAEQIIKCATYELVILDEIDVALDFGLLNLDLVLDLLNNVPDNVNVLLTGRNCPDKLIEFADLVTEMKKIKHPFDNDAPPQQGLDF